MNDMQKKEIGLKLKSIRERADIDRREMANYLCVSYAHINMVESGRATLSLELFLQFLKLCKVSMIEIDSLREYY